MLGENYYILDWHLAVAAFVAGVHGLRGAKELGGLLLGGAVFFTERFYAGGIFLLVGRGLLLIFFCSVLRGIVKYHISTVLKLLKPTAQDVGVDIIFAGGRSDGFAL